MEREGSSHALTNRLCISHSSFAGKSKKKLNVCTKRVREYDQKHAHEC